MTPEEVWQQYSAAYGVDSVEAFQKFFGLMNTGLLDDDTTKALTGKRCGVRDNLVVISEAKWRKRELSWFVRGYPSGLPRADVDSIYREAWDSWGAVCDKRFRQVGSISQADVILDVGTGRQDGFDGPGGTLAWMTLGTNNDNPILGRFDSGEHWTNDPNRDIYLRAVAAHEFGHALNLDHAPQSSGALMAPFYRKQTFKPQQHDIQRIQALYGPPTGEPTPPIPTPPGPTPTPDVPGDEGWLRRLYQDTLGRQPSAAEIAAWMQVVRDRPQVCRAVLNSSEYHTRLILGWYELYLKRKPDAGGQSAFQRALDAGMNVKDAQAVILSSTEYHSRKSGVSVDLDPSKPFQPDPEPSPPTGGGFMDLVKELLIAVITAALEPFRKIPFLGRFITPERIEQIVNAILRRLNPAQVQALESALQASPVRASVDIETLKAEVIVEIGEVPTS